MTLCEFVMRRPYKGEGVRSAITIRGKVKGARELEENERKVEERNSEG